MVVQTTVASLQLSPSVLMQGFCFCFVFQGSMLIELVCLVFFLYRKLHVCHFQEARIFWRDTKNYMVLGTIVVGSAMWHVLASSQVGAEM